MSTTITPTRQIRWMIRPGTEGQMPVIRITTTDARRGMEFFDYFCTPTETGFEPDWLGFVLEKIGGEETYTVTVDVRDRDEPAHRCDCQGFRRWKKCKHSAGLLALCRADALERSTVPAA